MHLEEIWHESLLVEINPLGKPLNRRCNWQSETFCTNILGLHMTRLEANKEILARLKLALKKEPDLRFGQLLRNLGIVREMRLPMVNAPLWMNGFNLESTEILAEMDRAAAVMKAEDT